MWSTFLRTSWTLYILRCYWTSWRLNSYTFIQSEQEVFTNNILLQFLVTKLLKSVLRTTGQSFNQLKWKLQYDYPQALVANYCLWPAANFINFRFVPLQHRILYVSGKVSSSFTFITSTSKIQNSPSLSISFVSLFFA